jgi:hypothetical protein
MSDIDLCDKHYSGTWVRVTGEHEEHGFQISLGLHSVHITIQDLQLTFAVEERDIPAAFKTPIDVVDVREQLLNTIVKRMSVDLVLEFFKQFRSQRQQGFWDGERQAKAKIQGALREALGL